MSRWGKTIALGLTTFLIATGVGLAVIPDIRTEARRWLKSAMHPLESPGFSLRTFIDSRNHERKYCLFVPHTPPPDDGYPTILYLNGFGENGDDGIAPLYNGLAPAIWERQHEFPFVVVFAQCHKGESWTRDSMATKQAFAMLDEVRAACPLDADRQYVTGVSAGASAAWVLGATYSDRFAALVAVSSGPDSSLANSIAAAGLPCRSYYVRGDSFENANREMRAALIDAGASPRFTELDGTPRGRSWNLHNSWDHAFRDPALYEWLSQQRRSANSANAAPFRRLFDSRDSSAYRCADPSVWEIEKGEIRSLHVVPADSRLETTAAFREFEFHLEFRTDELRPGESEQDAVGAWALEIVPAAADTEAQGLKLTFPLPDRGPCELLQLPEQRWLADGDRVAASSFRSGEWNDVRLHVSNGHVLAELNGWPLLSVPASFAGETDCRISLSRPPGGTGSIAWRDARVRALSSSKGKSDGP